LVHLWCTFSKIKPLFGAPLVHLFETSFPYGIGRNDSAGFSPFGNLLSGPAARTQMVRDQFGPEAAQAVLGHSSLTATQIYAKERLDLAKELAAECG
jgi:hypothetical protein